MNDLNILVAGFYDRLHLGHIKFLKKASKLGNVFVNVGNDKNLKLQKNKKPLFNEKERTEMLNSLRCVFYAEISKKIGKLDWLDRLKKWNIDLFAINDDGDSDEKKQACLKLGVPYVILMNRDKKDWSTTRIQNEKK